MGEKYSKLLSGKVTRSNTRLSQLSEFLVKRSVISSFDVQLDDQLGAITVPCSNEVAHTLVGKSVTITVEVLPEGRGDE